MKRPLSTLTGIALVVVTGWLAPPARFWAAYAASTLFWLSLCAGAAAFVAALEITGATWSDWVVEQAESWARLFVMPALALAALPLGAAHLYPWAQGPLPGLEVWFAPASVLARDAVAVLVLGGSIRWLLRGKPGQRYRRAVTMAMIWAAIGSLLAWDLIMSLEPGWTSTLFGAYFFVGALYTGMAAVAVRGLARPAKFTPAASHDLGKLLFGGAMIWSYFLWSQYLVAWYGNFPREAEFWLRRAESGWAVLGLLVIAAAFLAPFVLLLSAKVKSSPRALALLSIAVLASLWAEKILLLGPAVRLHAPMPIGLTELAVGTGLSLAVVGLLPEQRA